MSLHQMFLQRKREKESRKEKNGPLYTSMAASGRRKDGDVVKWYGGQRGKYIFREREKQNEILKM